MTQHPPPGGSCPTVVSASRDSQQPFRVGGGVSSRGQLSRGQSRAAISRSTGALRRLLNSSASPIPETAVIHHAAMRTRPRRAPVRGKATARNRSYCLLAPAEGEGFEPSSEARPPKRFSRPAHPAGQLRAVQGVRCEVSYSRDRWGEEVLASGGLDHRAIATGWASCRVSPGPAQEARRRDRAEEALGRLTCDVEPQVPDLVLRNRVGGSRGAHWGHDPAFTGPPLPGETSSAAAS